MQDIYVGDHGKGTPLVLVHGFLGSSKMWLPQIAYLKNYFRVITLDIPGFGKSNKAKSHNNIEDMAKALINCLNEKKINKFHLLGHSMGGMIVQEMTKISNNRVLKLVCYSTGSRGEMPGRFETVEKSIENLKKKGLEFVVKRIVKTWFVNGENAKYFNTCVQSGMKSSPDSVNNALIAFKKWNGTNNLRNIINKTLIIWGDQDKSYTLDQVMILKKNIKNSKLSIFKNCSHNVHLENLKKFNQTVKDFLH